MAERNFLLGYGERLVEEIAPIRRQSEKKEPYAFPEAKTRLAPMIQSASAELDELPIDACPHDEAVGVLTLHPEYLAKSFFPEALLREANLQAVGSRPRKVRPEKWTRKGEPHEVPATELFVAGPRSSFRAWGATLETWTEEARGASDLVKLEHVRAFSAGDKVRHLATEADSADVQLLEVALHADPRAAYVLQAFEHWSELLGAEAQMSRRLFAGHLCFLPVRAPRNVVSELARFSYLRVARPMPALRPFNPILRNWSGPRSYPCQLPDEDPVDPRLHAAVFDGGMVARPELDRWVGRQDASGLAPAHSDGLHHGSSVSSALLFGPLQKDSPLDAPYCRVEHFRVIDEDSGSDDDLYDVLIRVRDLIESNDFKFINLSIGPDIPLDDDEVHGWTAVLDDLLSKGDVLATVAAGNGGDRDAALGYNRIQVPADGVNALSVGAADAQSRAWRRAAYSSIGPGRSPGLVKPDVLAFGGSRDAPFWVVDPDKPSQSYPQAGTSFAAPLALRSGLGIRAHFGDLLSPLAIKALLVHCSDPASIPRKECGWGRLPAELDDYVVCPEGTARVVYQGEISPAQYIRARIPLPENGLSGLVTIRATFCFATPVDPDHPGNYTRSGLEIFFRPHAERFDPKAPDPQNPKTDSFFQQRDYETEQELRRDALKWETTLHREKRKRAAGLKDPMFDVHYIAREGGGASSSTEKVRYALVITVRSPKTKDLYDRIVRRYPTLIRPLTPLIQIPIRSRG